MVAWRQDPIAVETVLETIAKVPGDAPDCNDRGVRALDEKQLSIEHSVLSGGDDDLDDTLVTKVRGKTARPNFTLHVNGLKLSPLGDEPGWRVQILERQSFMFRKVWDCSLGWSWCGLWWELRGMQCPQLEVLSPGLWGLWERCC